MRYSNFLYDINPISKKIETSVRPRYRQAYVALGPTLLTVSLGMIEGFSAIFLPQLLKENNAWNITTETESWIASIATIPMPFACLVGGYTMEIIGRKVTHILDCLICILGWVMLYYSTDTSGILVARSISGFSVSLIAPAAGVYFAETSDPSFRSPLLALLAFGISFGIFLSHLLGIFLAWRHVALLCCIPPTLSLVFMLFAPESPTFLIKTNRTKLGQDSFYWCRGNDPESEKELIVLLEKRMNIIEKQNVTNNLKMYLRPEFIKPLLVMIVFFFTLQWCGTNALVFYMVDILELSLGAQINNNLSMVAIDLIRVIFSLVALYLQNKLPRRSHAIYSILGVLFSLISLAATLFANRYYPVILETYNAVILVFFVSYMIFLSIGLSSLPWTVIGEVFPLASKGMGNGITTCINFVLIFSVVKSTPVLFKLVGKDIAFFVYSICTFVGLVILGFFLPETKDKPLHEIEESFKNAEIEKKQPNTV